MWVWTAITANMSTSIAFTCLVLAVISFGSFVFQVYLRRKQFPKQFTDEIRTAAAGANLDLAKLIEAFAKLADSLEKMGPLAMSLFAAMFFMVMALLAAGLGK
jgi:hypothetical protein